jgi:hypothetical protein
MVSNLGGAIVREGGTMKIRMLVFTFSVFFTTQNRDPTLLFTLGTFSIYSRPQGRSRVMR